MRSGILGGRSCWQRLQKITRFMGGGGEKHMPWARGQADLQLVGRRADVQPVVKMLGKFL